MALPGFLDSNAARSYPFAAGATGRADAPPGALAGLPTGVVLDFGAEIGPGGYDPERDETFLSEVRRAGPDVYFLFRTEAPAAAGRPLVFRRPLAAARYAWSFPEPEPADPPPGLSGSWPSASAAGGPAAAAPWWGYLVTGDLSPLAALPDGAALTGRAAVEPALVAVAGGVDRLVLLTDPPTAWASDPACGGDPPAARPPALGGTAAGRVVWADGYNLAAATDAAGNRLVLTAAVGAGAGEPCGPWPAAGPGCRDVLRVLAGAAGPRVELAGGVGVRVLPDPAGNAVTLDFARTLAPGCDSHSGPC